MNGMIYLLIEKKIYIYFLEAQNHRTRRSIEENDEEDFIDFNLIKKFLKKQTNLTFHQEIKHILKEYFQDFPLLQNLYKEIGCQNKKV